MDWNLLYMYILIGIFFIVFFHFNWWKKCPKEAHEFVYESNVSFNTPSWALLLRYVVLCGVHTLLWPLVLWLLIEEFDFK